MTNDVEPNATDLLRFESITDFLTDHFNINNPSKKERMEWTLQIAAIHYQRLLSKKHRT